MSPPAQPRTPRTPRDTPTSADAAGVARRLLLRGEVGAFRSRESRRVFDTSVYVGELGGPRTGLPIRAADLPAYDTALRTDVVDRLLEDSPEHWRTLLLVRAGSTEQHDLDLLWLAAARTAFGSHGRALEGCYVVTRSGWRNVLTDETRTWARLRL